MIEELARHRCTGDDGTPLFVVEHRYVFTSQGGAGSRQHRGAAWVTLLNGEPVRYIDARTFEVIATGEMLAHDLRRCDCAPAFGITSRDGGGENVVEQV
ncbi:hypothetical protein GCM10008023_38320 [Sphingomonas glacialis]|uniref:Uncharacterized protein n=1 Tax=Sphingomonas glacialis TaxID=658225 RepID=A0ABQ3LSU0_9SPHN|nr:hypothetical protein [Sphingomonas glacialis]GHH25226.1 hypothetical protein GCM10008023_38320 [Sphingomonas glacialis]